MCRRLPPRRGDLLVQGNSIAQVALRPHSVQIADNSLPALRPAQVIDGSDLLLMPGFVDAHTHLLQTFARGLMDGLPLTAALPWGATTTLKGSFVRDLYMVDPVAEITAFKGPLLVIVGLNDTIVSPQPQSGEIYLVYHQGDEALVQLDADHMFDCLARLEKVDEAICATVTWLDKTL